MGTRKHRIILLSSLVFLAALFRAVAHAHDSPNDVIDAISHRIEKGGATASLLVSRAYEYRAYGDMVSAEMDLKTALELDASNGPAYISLAQLYTFQERSTDALRIVQAGLESVSDGDTQAALNALAAEAYVFEEAWGMGLERIGLALEVSSAELDWILLKSQLLSRVKRYEERVEFVRGAVKQNASVVLGIELVDTLRDARHYAECVKLINGYLEKRRWKAEWLLRRARVFQLMGNSNAARADAERALDEIEGRLNVSKPDALLYEARATAHTILSGLDSGHLVGRDEDDTAAIVSVVVLDDVE